MIIQFVRLKSSLDETALLHKAREREEQFKSLPGLVQKYYVKLSNDGEYGGIYLWDSIESLNRYRQTDLAKSIPEAYQVSEAPDIEVMKLLFKLREG